MGARYQFVSQSAFPDGDICLYDFDYSNADGFGSASSYDTIAGDFSAHGIYRFLHNLFIRKFIIMSFIVNKEIKRQFPKTHQNRTGKGICKIRY